MDVLRSRLFSRWSCQSVQYLKGRYGSVDMGAMMGALVLSIIPIVIFYLCCQKHIIEGVVAGAVKG